MYPNNPQMGGLAQLGGRQMQPPMQAPGGVVPPQYQHQGPRQGQGMFAGYTGPMPGTPEVQQARQDGQHPIMDWFRSQHHQGGTNAGWNQGRFGGQTQPNMQPWNQPRQANYGQSSYGLGQMGNWR